MPRDNIESKCPQCKLINTKNRSEYKQYIITALYFHTLIKITENNEILNKFKHLKPIALILNHELTPTNANKENDIKKFALKILRPLIQFGKSIAVVEKGPTKNYHIHILIFSPQRTDNLIRSIKTKLQGTGAFNIHGQIIKNLYNFICYIRKDPLLVYHNHYDMYTLFNIDIDQKNSQLETANTLADFKHQLIHLLLENNITDINELMGEYPGVIAPWLHKTALHKIFDNCLQFVQAINKKTTNILQIIHSNTCSNTNINRIFRILNHNNIDIDNFNTKLKKWLLKTEPKRNTFVLLGQPNTGKSIFARGLLSIIPLSGEIVNGNAFNYMNLQYKNYGIWEEPTISDENVEKFKLVAEGASTLVDVKHKQPFMLHRTPIIITTNDELHKYVSNTEQALDVRCFKTYFEKPITFSGNSKCLLSEITDTEHEPTNSRIDIRSGTIPDDPYIQTDGQIPSTSTSSQDIRPSTPNPPLQRNITTTNSPSKNPNIDTIVPHECDWVSYLKHIYYHAD
uniref:NS1 protein n=1 Tax=Coleura bat parvovirus TaxID=3141917 RepID=A0AAU7E1U0_9VIRU